MLKGEKVLLRALRDEDIKQLAEFNNDVEYELLAGGDPWEPQTFAQFAAQWRHWARRGPLFAIEADGKLIGTCGLFHFDETARTCELGIGIGDRNYWGRGYGRDALRVLLNYAFRLRNLHKVCLRVDGINARAIGSYQAVGFVEEARLRAHVWNNGRYVDEILMGILRSEWEQAQHAT
ncbi:MAG TPA: GNAT family protein [Ktedonobacterales bacterium]|jgi:RimJ/RimL family protein N-acetyltransferase